MKATKIFYWVITSIIFIVFAITSTLYLTYDAVMVAKLNQLHYPLYLLNILGTAKLIGVIVLIVPKFPRLKEWAYAGFVIDLIGAFWSHLAVQGIDKAIPLLIPFALIMLSCITYRRLQFNPGTVIALY